MANKKRTKKPKVDPKEMYKEMVRSRWLGKPTPRLIELWTAQVKNLIRPLVYKLAEDRNDVESTALISILKAWAKYDYNRKNPFNYFTSVASNGSKEGYTEIKRNYDYNIDAIFNNNAH